MWMEDVLLLHDNTWPHVSLRTMEVITKLRLTVLPHPPYSPDLALSHCHLFGKLKDSICGIKVEDNDPLVASVEK
jgi:histone-lysine N-methyltransferase SETMAR